jgi:hypothetical protein
MRSSSNVAVLAALLGVSVFAASAAAADDQLNKISLGLGAAVSDQELATDRGTGIALGTANNTVTATVTQAMNGDAITGGTFNASPNAFTDAFFNNFMINTGNNVVMQSTLSVIVDLAN